MLDLEFIKREFEIAMNGDDSKRSKIAKVLLEVNLTNAIEQLERDIEKINKTTARLTESEKQALAIYEIYGNEIDSMIEELDNLDNQSKNYNETLIEYYTERRKKIAIENNLEIYFRAKKAIKIKEEYITEYKVYLNKLREI